MKPVLAIDPGPKVSGWAILDADEGVVDAGVSERISFPGIHPVVIERPMDGRFKMVDTAISAGRIAGRAQELGAPVGWMKRSHVCSIILGGYRGKGRDKRITQEMCRLYGWASANEARKSFPNLKSHAWQALGLAVAAQRAWELVDWE